MTTRRTRSRSTAGLPTIHELAWPTLKILERLGGCASIKQIDGKFGEILSIPEEILGEPHGAGPETEVEYRAAWARTYLKKIGAVENRSRGVWCITNFGRSIPDEESLLDIIKYGTPPPGSPPPSPIDPDGLPTIHQLAWPTLNVLQDLGGTASIKQISSRLAQVLRIPRELLEIRHPGGELSEFNYRALCARTELKSINAITENASNGMWSITDSGRRIPDEDTLLRMLGINGVSPITDREMWRDELLEFLQNMKPISFQSLCNQVLIRSGFRQIKITDRAGNGDMLGSGLLRVNLVSFHILFQFKRSSAPVDDAEVRDLRGAMMGRAEKGLFVTTGKFTDSASQEALRNGAPVIDLVNGIEFCDLLKELELGVSTKLVEVIDVDPEYFRNC